jgi:hypothetical protein
MVKLYSKENFKRFYAALIMNIILENFVVYSV